MVSARWLAKGPTDVSASRELIMIRRIVLSLVIVAAVACVGASQAEARHCSSRGYSNYGGYYGGHSSVYYSSGPRYYYGGGGYYGRQSHFYGGHRSYYGGHHGHGGGVSFLIGF